jgi:transitional endoplasmic reticulum ATPase
MMDNKDAKDLRIKVGELTGREDFGRGIARLDSKLMSKIGVKEGDVVEIEGRDKTGAIVIRSYPADIGLNTLRIDGLVRKNCDASIGELVTVRKAEEKEAKKLVLAPAQKGDIVRIHPNLLRQNLFLRPVNKGDIIVPNPVFKASRNHDEPEDMDNINDIFSLFFGTDMKEVLMPMGSMGTEIKLVVVDTKPDGIVQVSDNTEVELLPQAVEVAEKKMPTVTYEDIGGLSQIVPKIREMIETPLRHPEVFERLGVEPPKGVLLYGPPGTGKTLIAKVVANEAGAHFISVAGPEFMSKFYGESEENLRKIFEDADKNAPTIIFIDEIDAIAPKRDQVQGEVERRVVSTLLTQMDGLKSRGKVIVIAATNLPNMLDPALRRTGRFDREIEIPVPDKKGRKEILQIHTRGMPIEGTFYDDLATEHIVNKIEMKIKEHKDKEVELERKIAEMKKSREDKAAMAKLNADLQKVESHIAKLESLKKLKDDKDKLSNLVLVLKDLEHTFDNWEGDAKTKFLDSQKQKLPKDIYSTMETLIETAVVGKSFYSEIKQKGVSRDLDNIAEITFGFVGADISGLAKEAAMHALRGVITEITALKEGEPIPKEVLEKLKVTKDDFDYAMKMVQPSGMREVLMEIPKVKWTDVGGLEDVKEALKESVIWPIKNPDSFTRLGIRPPRGILLYGPPGTGKTYVVKALANEAGVNLIAVKGPELLSMYVGESERHIRDVFRRAKQVSPSIILFDEIDSLAPKRGMDVGTRVTEQVVSQMLTEMSGIGDIEGVSVIATTNRPDMLDPALLRPGRFDRQIYVPAPDEETRLQILKIHTKSMPLRGVNLEKIAKEAVGYSGADLEALSREAALSALREDQKSKEVGMKHFENALKKIRPSITDDMFKKYQKVVDDLKKSHIENTSQDKADRYIG